MTKQNDDVIDLRDVLHVLYMARVFILVLTAIGFLAGLTVSLLTYTRSEIKNDYSITSSIAVTSTTEDGLFTTRSDNPNSTDIHLAEDMVDSVIYVIKGDKTLNSAIEELGLLGITPTDIRNKLTLKQYNKTQIIEIRLEWDVADEGIKILDAINKVAPQILIDSLKIGSVTVVNEPKSSYHQPATVNIKLWIIFTAAGMIAGMGIAVLKMLFFPAVSSTRHIEDKLQLEVIGEIPYSKGYFSKKKPVNPEKDDNSDYAVVESFSSLAHILRHRLGDEKPVCLYVTSARPNEGKTCVLANLAVQLSEIESKVLMIDLDVRNPSLGELFLEKVDYYHSLNALYRGEVDAENAIVNVKPCLDILPVYLEHKPLALNNEILDIIKSISSKYDYVLMDASPVGISSDAMNLNKVAQTALFVVRQDVPLVSEAEAALTKLNKSGISVVGAVLNGASKLSDITYYHYYGKYNR